MTDKSMMVKLKGKEVMIILNNNIGSKEYGKIQNLKQEHLIY